MEVGEGGVQKITLKIKKKCLNTISTSPRNKNEVDTYFPCWKYQLELLPSY